MKAENLKTIGVFCAGVAGLVFVVSVTNKPRGLRLNNPMNVKHGNNWEGEENGTDKTFESFKNNTLGIRAGAIILINYFLKYQLNTLEKIISRFAPSSENKTTNYIKYVSERVGIGATTSLTQSKFLTLLPGIIRAMVEMEQGALFAKLVDDAQIAQGVELAKASKGLSNA